MTISSGRAMMNGTTLGESWHASLRGTTLAEGASPADLEAAISQQDAEAEAALQKLIAELLPTGVASCVSRQSSSLTISLPYALATHQRCMGRLEEWLSEQKLAHALAYAGSDIELMIVPNMN